MAKGGQTTTQTTGLDPRSQQFVDQQRAQAQGAAGVATGAPGNFFLGPDQRSIQDQISPFLDPFIQNVIGGVRGEFDVLRDQASNRVSDQAIQAGAFGGSRQGVAEGVRLGELDRAQTSQIGGLLSSGFRNALSTGLQQSELNRQLRERQAQEPLFRQQQAQQFFQGGLGPTGQVQTQTQPGGSTLGTIAGLGLSALPFFFPPAAPFVGAAGAGGLLGGGSAANDPAFTDPLFPGGGGFGQFGLGR